MQSRVWTFACRSPEPDIRISPTFVPEHAMEARISRDGPLIQTEVLGPISRNRIADMLHHMTLVSRASRRGLIVGFLRILCNWTCTDQRFKTQGYQQVCRVECPNDFGSLSRVSMFWSKIPCFASGFFMGFVFKFHSDGTSLMRNFDNFTNDGPFCSWILVWSIADSVKWYTLELVPRLSAPVFSQTSTLSNDCIWILSYTIQLRYTFRKS